MESVDDGRRIATEHGHDVQSRIRGLLPELPEALRQVGGRVLAEPAELAHSTIADLARRSGTSAATVTRFSRAVGFTGYNDLRLSLTAELARHQGAGWEVDVGTEISPHDPLSHVLNVIRAVDTATINETCAQLDLEQVEQVAVALAAARRTDVFGIGGSGMIANELQHRLHRINRPAWSWSDPHAALTSAALLGPQDVALAISHSGRTRETVEVLAEARKHGATTVAITNFPRAPITAVADLVLTTAIRETTFHPEALASRHSALVVVDCVYIAVAQRTYGRTTHAFTETAEAVAGHRIGRARST